MLPTFNEKKNAAYMINSIKQYDYDLIVSDYSSDGTAEIAKSLGVDVFRRKKLGYGEGIKESLEIAKERGHTHLLVLDCDRTYPTEYIPQIWALVEEGDYDFINAGRRMKDIHIITRYPNMLHTFLTNLVHGCNYRDINSGMKLMKIDKFINEFTASGNDSTVQTIIIATKKKYKVKEIEIPYQDRRKDASKGKPKIRIRDGLIIIWRIFLDKFRN